MTVLLSPRLTMGLCAGLLTIGCLAQSEPSRDLRVVIVRHGEKPKVGENLTCQGENRALQLPAVLYRKFGKPDFTYVPSLGLGSATLHARMFQTVTPMAIRYDLTIDSTFAGNDYAGIVKSVFKKTGTVLMVWNHTYIQELAKRLGVAAPPSWEGKDFDSIWVVTFSQGKAELTVEHEGLTPSTACGE
jgi:hypothetical protein